METVDAFPATPPEPASDAALSAGTLIGAYRLQRLLGEGGMGRVYVAEHVHIGRRVALKMLRKSLVTSAAAVDRFFTEAQVVNRIRHPGIVEVTDLFVDDGTPCIVMELLEGRTLAAEIAKGPLAAAVVVEVGVQIADALRAAHAHKVIHRDLKPDNVVLLPPSPATPAGPRQTRARSSLAGGPEVKILDFGVAKLFAQPVAEATTPSRIIATTDGVIIGTPEYMAPEQLAGRGVEIRSDIYALGVCLYEALAGVRPFSGDTFGDLVVQHLTLQPPPLKNIVDVPADLEALVFEMLAKEPHRRPPNMAAVVDRLRAIGGARPLEPPAPRGIRTLAAAAAFFVAVICAGVAVVAASRDSQVATLAPQPLTASVLAPPSPPPPPPPPTTTTTTTPTTPTTSPAPVDSDVTLTAVRPRRVEAKAPTPVPRERRGTSSRALLNPFATGVR